MPDDQQEGPWLPRSVRRLWKIAKRGGGFLLTPIWKIRKLETRFLATILLGVVLTYTFAILLFNLACMLAKWSKGPQRPIVVEGSPVNTFGEYYLQIFNRTDRQLSVMASFGRSGSSNKLYRTTQLGPGQRTNFLSYEKGSPRNVVESNTWTVEASGRAAESPKAKPPKARESWYLFWTCEQSEWARVFPKQQNWPLVYGQILFDHPFVFPALNSWGTLAMYDYSVSYYIDNTGNFHDALYDGALDGAKKRCVLLLFLIVAVCTACLPVVWWRALLNRMRAQTLKSVNSEVSPRKSN